MGIKARIAAAVLGASLLSVGGISLIKSHEGLRYTAYPDPGTGGVPWTICYGHTKDVRPGQTATQAQCDRYLREDLAEAEYTLKGTTRVALTQGEYNAYVSFIFNAGASNWRSSSMLRLLNQGDRVAACNQFPRWVYANKRKLKGLVTRRYEEQALCLSFGRIVYDPAQHQSP